MTFNIHLSSNHTTIIPLIYEISCQFYSYKQPVTHSLGFSVVCLISCRNISSLRLLMLQPLLATFNAVWVLICLALRSPIYICINLKVSSASFFRLLSSVLNIGLLMASCVIKIRRITREYMYIIEMKWFSLISWFDFRFYSNRAIRYYWFNSIKFRLL